MLTFIDTRKPKICVYKSWPGQHDTIHGQGVSSELRGLENTWASALLQTEARPWGLNAEPGKLNENQTGSGLKNSYHGFLENVLKEMKAVEEVFTSNDVEKEVLG